MARFNPPATADEFNLDIIATGIQALRLGVDDPSAVANGFKTMAVDNIVLSGATAPTTATITSTAMFVKGASKITVFYDVTGATTGLLVTVRGGISGFGYVNLRQFTASAGLQAFIVGQHTTGASPETNGLSRIDDIFIQATLAANTGAGTGVTTTLRTRFLTES